jgi:hypothetical protein
MSPVLPGPDPAGLPAPVWLLKSLLVLTFVLHLLPMNLILGGSFVAAWGAWRGGRAGGPDTGLARHRWRAVAGDLARVLPPATAFTITLGIAPLLFLQVLYGQLFYASSILMAWSWLGVIALLLAGYYAAYAFSLGQGKDGGPSVAGAAASALCFSLIAFVFTNNMTLMLRPEAFGPLYAADEHGLHLNVRDPLLGPRFLHFLIASFAFTGLVVAYLGQRRVPADAEAGTWMRAFGTRLFVAATALQLGAGLWFLFALPRPVRGLFLGGSAADTAVLWSAVALAALAVIAVRRSLGAGATAIGLTVVGMAIVRHRVREATLAPFFSAEALTVNAQTGLFLLFAALLLAGIAVVAWMARALARGRPSAP